MFEDINEEIVYNEEEENIAAGKASTNKFLTQLKNKRGGGKTFKREPDNSDIFADNHQAKSKYADIDLFDFSKYRAKPLSGQSKEKLTDKQKSGAGKDIITKESLLAGLPDRVKNIKTGVNTGKEERPELKYPEIEELHPESLMVPYRSPK